MRVFSREESRSQLPANLAEHVLWEAELSPVTTYVPRQVRSKLTRTTTRAVRSTKYYLGDAWPYRTVQNASVRLRDADSWAPPRGVAWSDPPKLTRESLQRKHDARRDSRVECDLLTNVK